MSDCMLLGLGLLHAHVLLLGCAGAPAARCNGFICNGRNVESVRFFHSQSISRGEWRPRHHIRRLMRRV